MSKLILRYTVSWLLIAAILLASFIHVPETPMDDVPLMDKWVHIVMYFTLASSLWIEYLRSHSRIHYFKLCIGAIVLPILMSGLIELLQAYCTEDPFGRLARLPGQHHRRSPFRPAGFCLVSTPISQESRLNEDIQSPKQDASGTL